MTYTLSIVKLKKQAEQLRKKEEQTRNKLRTALLNIQRLKRAYIKKLNYNAQLMHSKIAEAQASVYAKVAADLEQRVQKSVAAKEKALTSAIVRVEKQHMSKLTKGIAKKGKKIKLKKVPKKSIDLKVKKTKKTKKTKKVNKVNKTKRISQKKQKES